MGTGFWACCSSGTSNTHTRQRPGRQGGWNGTWHQPVGAGVAAWDDDGMDDAETIRVLLVDDHEVVRRGVTALLEAESDIAVVGEAGTAEQSLARVAAVRPDVAVLDVRLPDGSGV